jgi:hypothetical protein
VFTELCVLVEGVGVCDVTSRVHRVHATPPPVTPSMSQYIRMSVISFNITY